MTFIVRITSRDAVFDQTTDVSDIDGTRWVLTGVPGTYLMVLPTGTNIGVVNPSVLADKLQRDKAAGGLGPQAIRKSAAIERQYGVAVDDFVIAKGLMRFTAPPLAPPRILLLESENERIDTPTVTATGDPATFQFGRQTLEGESGTVLTNQRLSFSSAQPAENIGLQLSLVPLDTPGQLAGLIGNPVGAIAPAQDVLAAELVAGADVVLASTLSRAPTSLEGVLLFQNGLLRAQGPGLDYTLGGINGQSITWLALTGTAPAMAATDVLVAYYQT